MIKWWVALIIGVLSLCLGYVIGVAVAFDSLARAQKLLDEVAKELAEMKEIYNKCLTKERDRS